VTKDMLDLAAHIIKTKSGHFNPEKFEDHYERALKELLRKKDRGEKIEVPHDREPAKVINLMEALRRSAKRGACGCDPLSPSTAHRPSKRDEENSIACAPSKGRLKMPKAPISTGGKPGTMGGDGLTGPDQRSDDLHDQVRSTRNNAGSQDQARREQGRKPDDAAQRAEKKNLNGFAA
jgi:hypothetical protein